MFLLELFEDIKNFQFFFEFFSYLFFSVIRLHKINFKIPINYFFYKLNHSTFFLLSFEDNITNCSQLYYN